MYRKFIFLLIAFLLSSITYTLLEQWGKDLSTQLFAGSNTPHYILTKENYKVEDSLDVELLKNSIQKIDTTFNFLGDNYRLEAYQIWRVDSNQTTLSTSKDSHYWLINNGDTVIFENKLKVQIYQNNYLICDKEFDKSLYRNEILKDEYSSHRICSLNKIILNSEERQIYFEQSLEIPMADYTTNGYFGINLMGDILFSGISGLCQDGIQLSNDKKSLLTCDHLIKLDNLNKLKIGKNAALSCFVNDSVICVINDPNNLDDLTNANIITTSNDTLFSFLFQNIEFDSTYKISYQLSEDKKKILFYDYSIGELIVFNTNDIMNPQYYVVAETLAYKNQQFEYEKIDVKYQSDLTISFYFNKTNNKLMGYYRPELAL